MVIFSFSNVWQVSINNSLVLLLFLNIKYHSMCMIFYFVPFPRTPVCAMSRACPLFCSRIHTWGLFQWSLSQCQFEFEFISLRLFDCNSWNSEGLESWCLVFLKRSRGKLRPSESWYLLTFLSLSGHANKRNAQRREHSRSVSRLRNESTKTRSWDWTGDQRSREFHSVHGTLTHP